MIKSFRCKETEKIFHGRLATRFPKEIQRVALRKLTQIHGAATLTFLRVPPGGTGWRRFPAIEKANGASGSMTDGGSAFIGRTAMPMMLKLSITIEGVH